MRRSHFVGLALAIALVTCAAGPAAGDASLAGVHWYSGDSAMLDLAAPAGERGYNVEVIFDTGWCDGDPGSDPGGVRAVAATARAHGLVNIIRVDYRQLLAVPTRSAEYAAWATAFVKCTQELADLASLFVVGNEPNIEDGGRPEGDIRGDEYASAFNHLYARKAEMPPGTQLLATFNSPFTPPGWMLEMSSRLTGVDGFALHTGGVRASCRDPRQPCAYGGWPFDGAFRYYRDVIASIHSSFWSRPVYITEFNTYTGDPGSEPASNYPADWINQAFEEIRGYNASRGSRPAVKALCWFVDRPQSWPRFALRNIGAARTDMGEELKNPANRGAGAGCPNDALAVPSDRWKLEIWNNRDLAGATVEQRYDAAGGAGFSYDWGSGRPTSCVGSDGFGVRFTRRAYFATSGSYTFTATTDDGVRLYVDGTRVIEDWRDMAPTSHTATVSLAAGWHDLRMDYYENAGGAVASLGWTGGGAPPANVARGAVGWAASSVYAAAYGGDKAYDGIVSVASKWTSSGAAADSWLALDLGRSYDVTHLVVRHAGSAGELTAYNTQAFRVESGTSLAGPWTTLATAANAAQASVSTLTLTAAVSARFVRLYITDAGIDNYARIPELEVYGTPTATPPPANRAPTAVATAAPTGGTAPLAVSFSGAGSSDPDGDALTYAWRFGDGTTGTGAAASHTYSAPGRYEASLTVDDGRGGSASASVAVTVLAPAGPLANGDFEASPSGGPLGTGWIAFASAGYPPTYALVSDQVHGGSLAQRVTTPQPASPDKYAGIYQVASVTPGVPHAIRAWSRTHFAGGGAWDHIARMGIDLAGGNDFQASSVQWLEFDSAKDTWHPLETTVTASGGRITIFLESWRKWAAGGDSATWFDDVQLLPQGPPPLNHPPTAVATAHPTSGVAPLSVSFSGSGSSDPDGDPLTFAWSFGDGAQGTGASVSHTYASAGSYAATLGVDDGRGGTHSAEIVIVVDPLTGNRPPAAVISANPKSATIPFSVTLDGRGSSDPDGDALSYSWSFADGLQGSGPTLQRSFVDANGDMRETGGYRVTLSVSDGKGGTASASTRIGVFPPDCPAALDFDEIRAQLAAQGQDLAFVKVGFHTGGGGTFNGLGKWEHCLDAAGVPFAVKSVPNSRTAGMGDAADLAVRSGVPHTIVFRRCCEAFELPACAIASASTAWSSCTLENAQQEARAHWQRHLQAFPPDVQAYKRHVWVETINEPWKGSNTRNNAEWLARFSYFTALEALAAGYNYAAFGWTTGEPEYGEPPKPDLDPSNQWDGPEMQSFLRLAAQHPDRIAISLHEYDLGDPTLRESYPHNVGRFEKLFERCDANGIARPSVLITEFGWPGVPGVSFSMSPDNIPWASELYARHPQVKGVHTWDGGDLSPLIPPLTAYALQHYFAIPIAPVP